MPNTTFIRSINFDQSGNIICAGTTLLETPQNISRLTISKTNSNGIADASFGVNGIVSTEIEYEEDVNDMAIQSDDKILVVGNANLTPPTGTGGRVSFAIRYNTDGSIDQNFATAGIFRMNFPIDSFESITILPDGSMILSANDDNNNAVLVKLTSQGSIDSQFGENGILSLYSEEFKFFIRNTLITSDNKIVCVGYDVGPGYSKFAYCKVDEFGNFDLAFGNNGKVITETFNPIMNVGAGRFTIKETNEGKLILGRGGVLIKINADGTFDSSFGINGVVVNIGPTIQIEILPDEKIILGRTESMSPYNNGYLLERLNSDGTPDYSFNGNGSFNIDPSPDHDYIADFKLQETNKIVIGSNVDNNGIRNFSLSRILLEGSLGLGFFENNDDHIKVHPNPFQNNLNINSSSQIKKISVFDESGRNVAILYGSEISENTLGNLKRGLYLFYIETQKTVTVKKLLKL